MIKLNLKTTLLALTLALVSSSSVYAATYTVKSGDTLGGISKAYNTTTNYLMKNNKLSNYNIYSGQVLTVPTNTHNVARGDTLYLIAKKYNITLDKLRIANDKWDDNIYPGDVFKIPTASTNVKATPLNSSKVIPYSNSDVNLLARLINAEAGGESYDTMLSVGAVVVNRVQSSQFPSNISGVINEKSNGYYQFTPVMNGMINKAPTDIATKAAYESLKGSDPTNGALYFFENTVTNKWLTSKTVAAVKGNLTFAY
ncbi:LysM peptidoglycan-binding domain-containing protein [Clostridium tagluense]|nr:LysM peptidoglycan-binding domain-containing protein [Clostridium tagluense]WLC67930.1 LysM peptidoglycan-binding domain-containing protein [Clostridium tagluense]